MIESFHNQCYENENNPVFWHGIELNDCESFQSFLSDEVAALHLSAVTGIGFEREDVEAVSEAKLFKERDWLAKEALPTRIQGGHPA